MNPSYSLPSEITIPLLDVTLSLSTCIAIVILLILFFTFFSLSISIGGSLSPKNVASELNICDANLVDLENEGKDLLSNIGTKLEEVAVDVETQFMGGMDELLDGMGNEATGAWNG